MNRWASTQFFDELWLVIVKFSTFWLAYQQSAIY